MPNVIASRSIANEPSSALLRRTKRSPSAIERRTGSRGPSSVEPIGGWGDIAAAAGTLARERAARVEYAGAAPPRPIHDPPKARRARDGVRGADARAPDHEPAEPRPDDVRELRQPEVQRDRRVDELGRDEVRQDRQADDVLDGGEPGEQAAEDVEGGDRRRAEERAEREAAGGEHERDLVDEQQRAAVVAVGERAAEQRHRHERAELDGAEQAGEERQVRLDVELVGERDERRLRPEPRHDGARDEQPQVARGAQRRDVDGEAGGAGPAPALTRGRGPPP